MAPSMGRVFGKGPMGGRLSLQKGKRHGPRPESLTLSKSLWLEGFSQGAALETEFCLLRLLGIDPKGMILELHP